jgi:hypothetical protein
LTSALPAGYRAATPVIRGVTYEVAEIQLDGAGAVVLELRKA